MRNFIQRLKAAWAYGKHVPYIEEADEADYWTDADAEWLAGVFKTGPGKKLQARLNNMSVKAAVVAVRQTKDHVYQSGVAAGIHMGMSAISAHFPQAKMVEEPESEAIEIFEQAEA